MRKISKKRAASAKAKQRANITFRMNILFFSIFLLFSILIFRLGFLQIVQGEEFVRELERTEEVPINTSVPRGRIYDSEGRILVDNEPQNAITYTKLQTTTQEEMLKIAEMLASIIKKETDDVTLRDKQDYWIMLNRDKAYERVTKKEEAKMLSDETLTTTDMQQQIDKLVRERITEQDLASLTDEDLEVLAIYREMSSGYALSPQIIKSNEVTPEEFARVSERLTEMKGVNTTTDWVRVPKSTLSILGRTTSPKEGIPKSSLDYYMSRDYTRNDRVGRSYLELQYEEVLQGQKSVVKNITDGKGTVTETETVFEGQPGKDLVLTIDSEINAKIESLVEAKLLAMKQKNGSHLLDRAFVVIMDPNSGEIVSMVGKKLAIDKETNKRIVQDYAYGTFTSAYEIGSTIKPATVLTGYDQGVIQLNERMIDEPIKIKGSKVKSSVFNRSSKILLSDLEAIERSSNVYMFKIGFRLANAVYKFDESIDLDDDAFGILRNSYAQFGLGVPTGIDLPGETSGINGGMATEKLLDLTIGQFDTYTPLQMAQYVATIANGGSRIQPHVVKEIREPSTDGTTMGPLVTEIGPTVLNRIHNTQEQIDQIKKGMSRVYYGSNGSARSYFGDAPYQAAGKTGTAQVVYYDTKKENWGDQTINSTHIGFAPFDKPEIAYAVIMPWAPFYNGQYESTGTILAREVVDAYYEIKNKKKAEESESSTLQTIKPAFSETLIEEDTEEATNE
ncbi:penicillin-binding protein 2 [Paenisporosarcina sp. OV554]|uniref:peptidoglycan D,D-transpeptidase FtsI family protein n=1 Tax=Paenisporosarcina sp. OV554 TaxID=2135694 RepID=UPI000D3B0ED4|nr:penicillin-binding protein 2 [Paenisporosarcina sp. OV554]PUB12567.1 cell elongation-specific peptidoglycan D,D-transpeptidase [Paenisporosarcina sp. OV554]